MNEPEAPRVWTVDPGASLQSVVGGPWCPSLLRGALTRAHSWQRRRDTTVLRSLRAPRLMPQWGAALLVLGATVSLDGAEGGEEVAPFRRLEALLGGAVEGAVTALHIPIPGPDTGCGEAHVARTPSDEPIVAAFALIRFGGGVVEAARVALTGAGPEAVLLAEAPERLVGEPLTGERIVEVAGAIEDEVAPVGDYRGSEGYRRVMAGVLARRALEACMERGSDDE